MTKSCLSNFQLPSSELIVRQAHRYWARISFTGTKQPHSPTGDYAVAFSHFPVAGPFLGGHQEANHLPSFLKGDDSIFRLNIVTVCCELTSCAFTQQVIIEFDPFGVNLLWG